MAYGCFFDWEGKAERVCLWEEDTGISMESELEVLAEVPLYTSVCDLMGLDLYKVMVEIGNAEMPEETAGGYDIVNIG